MTKIPFPREHGTWAMLYVPIVIAFASAPVMNINFLVLIIAITSLFFLRDPLEGMIRLRMNDRRSLPWIVLYSTLALVCGGFLFFRGFTFLLLFLLLFVLLVTADLLLQALRQNRSTLSELMAIAGLTSSGLATRAVLMGELDKQGCLIWLLCFLFFSSSVFYVKMRIKRHARKDSKKIISFCILFHLGLIVTLITLAFYRIIPMYTVAAYFPVIFRAFMGIAISGKANLKRIGIYEVVYTIFFASVQILVEKNVL